MTCQIRKYPKESLFYTCFSGEILLVDVENKEILHSSKVEGEVNCVAWSQEKDSGESKNSVISKQDDLPSKYKYQDSSHNFLPKLPSLSRNFGSVSKYVEENMEDAKKIRDQTHLNILLVGLSNGKLYLSIFGLFPCGILDLSSYINGRSCSVLDADVSDDLNVLIVFLSCAKEKDNVSDDNQMLTIVLLDTSVLSARAAELYSLALKHGHIMSLLGYMAQTMHAITEAWENVLLEMDSKLTSYADTVPDGSVSADFLDLLMFGTASDELERFLLHDLTEKGLKKLGHSIELSYSNIQKLVLKHLNSVGQSLAYHLAELRGMARHTDRYQIIGLNEEAVDKSLRAAGSFLVKATEVQHVIDSSMMNYKAFFRWLYLAILRLTDERVPVEFTKMSQQELAFIADFLYSIDEKKTIPIVASPTSGLPRKPRFNLERLGQYLVDQDLVTPQITENNTWANFLEKHKCIEDHPAIIPHFQNMSLVQQHNHLKNSIEVVFNHPEAAIGKIFKLANKINCLEIFDSEKLRLSHVNSPDNSQLLIAFIGSPPPAEGFYFMELSTGDQAFKACTKCVYLFFKPESEEGPIKILDVQFYLPETLSVLLQLPNGEAAFLQLPCSLASSYGSTLKLDNEENYPSGMLLDAAPKVALTGLLEPASIRPIDSMVAAKFAVSGSRKVAVVLSESRRKVRLFEMEAEEEEEEDDGMDTTTNKESDTSTLGASRSSDLGDE